jgi:hypothetical protein
LPSSFARRLRDASSCCALPSAADVVEASNDREIEDADLALNHAKR